MTQRAGAAVTLAVLLLVTGCGDEMTPVSSATSPRPGGATSPDAMAPAATTAPSASTTTGVTTPPPASAGTAPPSAAGGLASWTYDPTDPDAMTPLAPLVGTLQERGGCLVVSTVDGIVLPLWPVGYQTGERADETVLLDHAGVVLSRVGEQIELSGGYGGDVEGAPNHPCRTAVLTEFRVGNVAAAP